MTIAGIVLILGFAVQVISMNSAMLVVGRFICGIAVGMVGGKDISQDVAPLFK